MFQLGSRLIQFQLAPGNKNCSAREESICQPSITFNEFLVQLRNIGGLKKEDIFCNLRIPNQFQTAKEEINVVILTGQGVLCVDVKDWSGKVSVQNQNWHLQRKEEDQNFTNTSILQVADPLQVVKAKAANLWSHVGRSGVSVRPSLFLPRVLFLSADCQLDEALRRSEELVPRAGLDTFLHSFRAGYAAWVSEALTPSWLSGHLSYRQLREVREVLRKMGTWDLVKLHCGQQLKGDFRGCRHIALSRDETDELEFSGIKALSAVSLWSLLGHSPQVTVKMYKRGGRGWLGKPLSGTATIPHDAAVVFRISGEDADAKIPASRIHSISLSV